MKKYRIILTIVVFLYIISLLFQLNIKSKVVLADGNTALIDNSIASIRTDLIDKDNNTYQVTLSVPGEDPIEMHDEIIVMIDGSTSVGTEWDNMKSALIELGTNVLNGKNNVKLTLMAFGISPNIVAEHIETLDELKAALPENPRDLRYGRSSTNCSAAFDCINDYVNKHDPNTLNKVHVLFITDGGVNMHSKEYQWFDYKLPLFTASNLHFSELYAINNGYKISSASKKTFSDTIELMLQLAKGTETTMNKLSSTNYENLGTNSSNDLVYLIEEYILAFKNNDSALNTYKSRITSVNNEIDFNNIETELDNLRKIAQIKNIHYTNDKAVQWATTVWSEFYNYSKLDTSKPYNVYICEKAMLDYQIPNNYYIEDVYYAHILLLKSDITNRTIASQYAIERGKKTSSVVDSLHLIQYNNDSYAAWMSTLANESSEDNITLDKASDLSHVRDELIEILSGIILTPFKDVNILNYTSKWVLLSPESIKVIDTNGNTIADYDPLNSNPTEGIYYYKWTNKALCKNKPPLIARKVPKDNFTEGGSNVIGNTNGDIYSITWNIKDGALTRAEKYHLIYNVKVDTDEEGFEYGIEYPANGDTNINYTDIEDKPQKKPINVPDVGADLQTPSPTIPTTTSVLPTPAVSTVPNKVTPKPVPSALPSISPNNTPSPNTGDINNNHIWFIILVSSIVLLNIINKHFKTYKS